MQMTKAAAGASRGTSHGRSGKALSQTEDQCGREVNSGASRAGTAAAFDPGGVTSAASLPDRVSSARRPSGRTELSQPRPQPRSPNLQD